MSAAVIAARKRVLLTKVVVRLLPFHRTTDDDVKLVPFAVSVNAPPPAVVLLGEIELRVGTAAYAAGTGGALATSDPTRQTAAVNLSFAIEETPHRRNTMRWPIGGTTFCHRFLRPPDQLTWQTVDNRTDVLRT